MTPHEAANTNSDTVWRPGREPGSGISAREYASLIWELLDLDDEAFNEAMRFDPEIWGA